MTNEDRKIRTVRKIHKAIRAEFDVDYLHGQWCGPQWQAAEKKYFDMLSAAGL